MPSGAKLSEFTEVSLCHYLSVSPQRSSWRHVDLWSNLRRLLLEASTNWWTPLSHRNHWYPWPRSVIPEFVHFVSAEEFASEGFASEEYGALHDECVRWVLHWPDPLFHLYRSLYLRQSGPSFRSRIFSSITDNLRPSGIFSTNNVACETTASFLYPRWEQSG